MYAYDETFFDDWHPDMAWVLGFVTADGWIRECGPNSWDCQIGLTDIDVLHQIKHLMDSEAPVNIYRDGYVGHFRVAGTAVTRDVLVAKYGLHPAKSRSLRWPNPPDQVLSHYVRGLWDGDGSIIVRDRVCDARNRGYGVYTYHEITAEYCCGTEQFVYDLQRAVGIEGHIRLHGRAWYLMYPYRKTLSLLEWIYQNSEPVNRLARKFEKYAGFLEGL